MEFFLLCILKVTEERCRIRRWIRIRKSEARIRTKMSRIPNTFTVLSEASQQLLFISDFCSQVSNFMLHVRIPKSDLALAPLCVYHNYKPSHQCCGFVPRD
jgi:hypothetical protein